MGQKNQKVIKIHTHVAEEIDNVGLNVGDGWHNLCRELEAILSAVPKKKTALKESLNLVHTGLEAMGAQTANDPLAPVEAVWQGLHSAGQRLSGGDVSEAQILETRQTLTEIINPLHHSHPNSPSAQADDSPLPPFESLVDAAGISEAADDIPATRIGNILVALGKMQRDQVEEVAAAYPDLKLGTAIVKSKAVSIENVGQALRARKRINSSQQAVESSVRVGTQRLDRLIDMVGELVIASSMVAQDELVADSDNHELAQKVSYTSKIARELQDSSMLETEDIGGTASRTIHFDINTGQTVVASNGKKRES